LGYERAKRNQVCIRSASMAGTGWRRVGCAPSDEPTLSRGANGCSMDAPDERVQPPWLGERADERFSGRACPWRSCRVPLSHLVGLARQAKARPWVSAENTLRSNHRLFRLAGVTDFGPTRCERRCGRGLPSDARCSSSALVARAKGRSPLPTFRGKLADGFSLRRLGGVASTGAISGADQRRRSAISVPTRRGNRLHTFGDLDGSKNLLQRRRFYRDLPRRRCLLGAMCATLSP
jgi:hypothetical protein